MQKSRSSSRRPIRLGQRIHGAMRTQRIRIRRCRPKDTAEVLKLWKRAAAAHSVPEPDRPAAVRNRLRRDRQLFLLAWAGSRLVGTLMGGWDGWRASMARLAVHSQYRRRGVARLLVERVERELKALGAKRISGIVLEDNRTGRAFWSSAGYRLDARATRYIKDLP